MPLQPDPWPTVSWAWKAVQWGGAVFHGLVGASILLVMLELWIAPYLRGQGEDPSDRDEHPGS